MGKMMFCEDCGNILNLKNIKRAGKEIVRDDEGRIILQCGCGCQNKTTIEELKKMNNWLSDSFTSEKDKSGSIFMYREFW